MVATYRVAVVFLIVKSYSPGGAHMHSRLIRGSSILPASARRDQFSRFSATYCPYGNIVNFLRTSQIYFCFKNTLKNAIQTNGREKPLTHPLPFGRIVPHLIHPSSADSTWLIHAISHNYATRSPFVTMRWLSFTPKLPLPFDDLYPI